MSFDINDINKQAGISTKEINGVNYTLHLLPATVGLKMSLEISKLLAPSIGASFDGLRHDELLHGAPKTFSDLATLLSTQLDKVDVADLISALLSNVEVDGKKINFDTHFRGNYGSMIQLVEFALRENFESFFTESGFQTRLMSLMESLKTPTPDLEESSDK
jgi:hypothetical protein